MWLWCAKRYQSVHLSGPRSDLETQTVPVNLLRRSICLSTRVVSPFWLANNRENFIINIITTEQLRNISQSRCDNMFWKRGFNILKILSLILLTWRIWWAPNNASKWQMGFNWVFKGLNHN
jgi:hypothetical protein